MSRDDGFLTRWSRRKLETREPPQLAEPAPLAPASDAPVAVEVPVLSAEELAQLPRIEDLTAESDLLPFLRKGVPTLLRNAALRRMWSADPAVRDFVGDARDYSYDWNLPGGVPGTGPLAPTDDVESAVSRLFGDRSSPSLAPEHHVARAADDPCDPSTSRESLDVAEEPIEEERALLEADPAPIHSAAPLPTIADADPKAPARRRHGSAVPTLE